MESRFRQLSILFNIPATVLLAVPAWASEDSLSMPSQGKCTMSALEVVDQFIDLFYRKKEVREAFERWVHPDYIQHKPTLPDGRDAVINFLEELLKRNPGRTFTVHRVIASDDLVAVHYHSQATPEDFGFAVVDIFRVEDCLMVEHWDVVQPVPGQSANDNTMF
jgi:predicted SnoaL-like aldol condensation-catalyzing enzyme